MKRFLGVRALVAASLVAVACFTISASAGAAGSSGTRIIARTPRVPNGAKALGPVSASATVSGVVVLRPRDEAGLTRFIAEVTDKHSAVFHHYLAPGAFADRFGPSPGTIATVTSQLRASGLNVTEVARDGMIVHFSAPANRVERAFRTGLERYKLRDGSIGQARTAPLRVPATIAKYVTSVVGLDNLVRLRSSSVLRAPKSARGTHPAAQTSAFIHPTGSPAACSDAQTAATEFGGLTDDQIANSYGAFGLYSSGDFGAGQHIAIYELEPFATSDIQTFDTCYFGATQASQMIGRLNTIKVDGGQTTGPGGGEATLDIQDVSAMAPGANIDVYEAPNTTFGAIDQYAKIVNSDVDQIVSSSWGLCEQAVHEGEPGVQQAENLIFQQAAAQGQSIFSAAGDEGSNDCNAFRTSAPVSPILSVDDPASQPYVVAVGGTTIDDATQRPSEHVWNDGAFWGAGGGGISESWPMPTWQLDAKVPGVNDSATVAAANSFEAADLGQPGFTFCKSDNAVGFHEAGCRELPDVSAQADEFTGAVTIYAGALGFGWTTIGGTSSAAPIWAALLADTNASPTCQANNATKHGVGFVNPLLYAVASSPAAYAASFNDITAGNNDQYGDSNLFHATTGYDMASGLGTPNLTQSGGGAGLAFYLCNAASASTRPTVTSVSPGTTFTSAPQTPGVTITGTGFEKSGTPDVADIQVGDVQFPTSFFSVTSPTTIVANMPPASFVIPPSDPTDGAGRVQVVMTLTDGESSAANANSTFTYVDDNSGNAIPAVTSVHGYGGPDAGGNVVQIFGTGFTGATAVTFGGVAATTFSVVHPWEIQATVPAFNNGVTTCDQDGSSFGTGENATNDICQAQVVVTNANGSSHTNTILPLYEGAVSFNDHGVIPAPSGEEAAPAPTEYDYLPTPTITSISTNHGGAASLASEEGGSVVTIDGKGFNLATLDWVNFGNPTQEASQNFFNLISVTGTKIEIAAPGLNSFTVNPTAVPVSVQTIAGLSAAGTTAHYAGIPTVSGVLATAGVTSGEPAGPDTGGTPIDIKGAGFANQVLSVTFNDVATPFSFGTQYNFTPNSNTDLSTSTVGQNPAVVDTQVCTATDCSFPTSGNNDPSDEFVLYPPGDPKIDSILPASGPSTGGTEVTITGENLGCVTDISFGSVPAETFSNQQALLDCGSTNTVTVTAPPGSVGTVPVTLNTVESVVTGAPAATGSFTYTAPPNETLLVHKSGSGSGTVTSSPAGISCGATCSQQFPQGTSVTLTANAAAGSSFAGWSGACSGTSTCTVTTNRSTSVTAKFTAKPKPCVVPKVKGKTLKAAKRALKAHSCRAGKIKHAFSSKVKKGRVVSQKPKPGKHLKHGGKVNLVVSKGKKH